MLGLAVVAQSYTLCRDMSARWIFEADIKGCFDNIRHDWILKNIPINKTILKKWLKSGYIEQKRLFPTKRGTPQGGTISPVIMNMVLDGLEAIIMKKFPRWKRQKVNFIRYADDFVITAIDKQTITNEIIPLVKAFLAERGLELSPGKSKISHINDGFNFLSQNVRKYKGKLLIHPSKETIQSFKDKLTQETVQRKPWHTGSCLNPYFEPGHQGLVELPQRHLLKTHICKVGNVHLLAAQTMG